MSDSLNSLQCVCPRVVRPGSCGVFANVNAQMRGDTFGQLVSPIVVCVALLQRLVPHSVIGRRRLSKALDLCAEGGESLCRACHNVVKRG